MQGYGKFLNPFNGDDNKNLFTFEENLLEFATNPRKLESLEKSFFCDKLVFIQIYRKMSANFKCILFATTTILCFLGLSTRLALALTITDGFETTRLQQCREGCLEKVCVCDYNKKETILEGPHPFRTLHFHSFWLGSMWMKWHEGCKLFDFLRVAWYVDANSKFLEWKSLFYGGNECKTFSFLKVGVLEGCQFSDKVFW